MIRILIGAACAFAFAWAPYLLGLLPDSANVWLLASIAGATGALFIWMGLPGRWWQLLIAVCALIFIGFVLDRTDARLLPWLVWIAASAIFGRMASVLDWKA